MKKILLITMLLLSFVSAVFAKTPPGYYNVNDENQLKLGGIKLNDTYAQVESMYGKPTESYRTKNPVNQPGMLPCYIWDAYYGKTVKLNFIQLVNESKLYVSRVESTANNGWQTPTGLTVGMKEEEIEKRMGKSYRDNNAYTYNLGSFRLAFYPKDGVISKIVLVSHDVHRD